MRDFISLIVVLIFILIVFRKRLAPLFKVFRKKSGSVETVVDNVSGQVQQDLVISNYEVLLFDVIRYSHNPYDLSEEVSLKLEKKLDHVRSNGAIIDVNVYPFGRFLMFLIKWRPLSGERV